MLFRSGRLYLAGGDSEALLQKVCTRNVAEMPVGLSRYTHICREDGGILDDVIVSRFEDQYLVVCNAANREKITNWLKAQSVGMNVTLTDRTLETAMIALQGPQAIAQVEKLLKLDLSDLKRYHFHTRAFMTFKYAVFRSGYTGEDGCELIVDAAHATPLWEAIMERGTGMGATAIGLGARDTLRLESAMPLYGHELTEEINPVQAGLGFALNLQDRDFIGRDAIMQFQTDKDQLVRIGLQLDGKRVPREGQAILQSDEPVGEVTSGTFSPTFERPIAMGYVKPTAAAIGNSLDIDIRGRQHRAMVVPLPFYERGKS